MDILVLDSQPVVSDINIPVKKWSDSELNSIWEKLFVPTYFNKINYDDTDVQGLLMLLQTAAENVKKLGSRYGDLLVCYNTSIKKIEEAEEEHIRLKTSLKSLNSAPCDKCHSLKIELKDAKQRAEDAETRMNSIAKILRLGEDGGKTNDVKRSNDDLSSGSSVNILSQLNKESTTKRKRCSSPFDKVVHVESEYSESVRIVDNNKEVLVSATIDSMPKDLLSQSVTNLELEEGEQVPETPVTPLNNKVKNLGKGHEGIEKHDEGKKIKCLSNSVNIPPNSKNKNVHPAKRNLSADFIGSNSVQSKCPEKKDILDSGISKNAVNNVVSSVAEMSNDSLAGFLKTSDTELDRIWFDGNLEGVVENEDKGLGNKTIKKKCSVKGGNKNDTKSVWKLRQNKGPDKSVGLKKFKQTTLGTAEKTSKKDISQMKDFSGGKFESFSCNMISDDDDIVMPSPKPKKSRRRYEADKFDTINLSLFAPVATSTQLPKKEINTSYDRIPDRESTTNSPNYKYKREPVRGKEARAKLEGRECEDCIKYYKATGQNLSPDKLKERINACSRHKQQQLRCKTPPGFWDPLMPSTEECRDRGMYTSIYCLKNSRRRGR